MIHFKVLVHEEIKKPLKTYNEGTTTVTLFIFNLWFQLWSDIDFARFAVYI